MQNVIEHFAIRFRGELAVDTPGTYTFWLLSDDGSKLYINDDLVINNDGIHGITSTSSKGIDILAHLKAWDSFVPQGNILCSGRAT